MSEVDPSRPLVGQPVPRVEDARLLRGRGRFVADLSPIAGIHHAAVVRSPHAHARVGAVDASAALALEGVIAVVTPDDARRLLRPFGVGVGGAEPYWPLALDTARYAGEPVAVVVARDRYVAEDAADLVAVDYEPLAPVLDVEAGRVVSDRSFRYGDPDAAFAAAAHRVEASFLPSPDSSVMARVDDLRVEQIDLSKPAVLERGAREWEAATK